MLQSASGGLKPAVLSGVIWGECTGTLLESDAEGPHEHLAFDSGEMEIETVAKGVRDLTGAGMV